MNKILIPRLLFYGMLKYCPTLDELSELVSNSPFDWEESTSELERILIELFKQETNKINWQALPSMLSEIGVRKLLRKATSCMENINFCLEPKECARYILIKNSKGNYVIKYKTKKEELKTRAEFDDIFQIGDFPIAAEVKTGTRLRMPPVGYIHRKLGLLGQFFRNKPVGFLVVLPKMQNSRKLMELGARIAHLYTTAQEFREDAEKALRLYAPCFYQTYIHKQEQNPYNAINI